VLINGSVLYIKEYVDAKYAISRVTYAYQFHDHDGNLMFRYDNAVHKPALAFTAHKHNSDGTIEDVGLPDIFDLAEGFNSGWNAEFIRDLPGNRRLV
jgi:hypothetical protein